MTEKITTDARREHIEELAASYSLGALTEETDLQEFEQLVESGDPVLSKNLGLMLEASAALAIASPIIEPPADIRASILDAVKHAKTYNGGTQQSQQSTGTSDAVRLKKRTRFFIGTSVLSGLLICYILALNVSSTAKLDRSNDLMKALLKQTDSLRNAITSINEPNLKSENSGMLSEETELSSIASNKQFFSIFSDADLHLVTLASTPLGAARQHIFFSPKKKVVYFVYDKQHPMDAGKTYQLSASSGSKDPVAIGTFTIDPKKDPPVYAFAAKINNANSFTISALPEHRVIFTGDMPKD